MTELSKQDIGELGAGLKEFLQRQGVRELDNDLELLYKLILFAKDHPAVQTPPAPWRWQDNLIAGLVGPGDSVLDLGCGDGDLLVRLSDLHQVRVQGVELNDERVLRCIERGLPVYHASLEQGLDPFPTQGFSLVVLQNTMQTLQRPLEVLQEMLRIGKRCAVSFPNFAHWQVRLTFSLSGRMPLSEALPYNWHDTPNIHLCSINDFLDWIRAEELSLDHAWTLVDGKVRDYCPDHNITAENALFVFHR